MNLDTLRPRILLRSFGAALVLILVLLALQFGLRASSLEHTLAAHYEQSFGTLSETLAVLEETVNASSIATTPDQAVSAAAATLEAAGTAKAALDLLPLTGENLDTLNRYLCQVGDYTLVRARKSIEGDPYTDAEEKELLALSQYTGELTRAVCELSANYSDKEMRFSEPTATLAQASAEVPLPTMQQELAGRLEALSSYGELVYDGVYSDRAEGASPLLSSLPPLSEEELKEKAAAFLGLPADSLQSPTRSEGTLPTYTFSDGSQTLELTERGGLPLLFFDGDPTAAELPASGDGQHTAPAGSLPYALEVAKEFLAGHGFPDLSLCYYQRIGDRLHAVFAYEESEVLCYPDRVTISLSIPDGAVCSLSAGEYLKHHNTERALSPTLGAEEAKGTLPAGWDLLSTRLCLIPTAGGDELLCYELLCTDGEKRALHYHSAENATCITTKLLYESENGVIAH